MSNRFDYFVVLAEMRTGSNFFEANLNDFDGLTCYGEAFNPQFVAHKGQGALLGVTMAQREADPLRLLGAMREKTDGMPGFRFFNDHDPRVLAHILKDPRCAKIVLTRNPLDSYVSLKIASQTGQWKLTDVRRRKAAKVQFDAGEFEDHLNQLHQFQLTLLHSLQTSGQSAFYVAYEDIGDLDVLNGLARWLGVSARLDAVNGDLKRQNPAPLSEKVLNYDAMVEALGRIDRFDLTRTPNFEPRRGPAVPGFVAAAKAPLLFMPLPGGPIQTVEGWLAEVDGDEVLQRGFTQKTLRQWKRRHPGHRSFTVVSHPLERAYRAYARAITADDERGSALRDTLQGSYKLSFPADGNVTGHTVAFVGFLAVIKATLAGQTSLNTPRDWTSQSVLLQGLSQFQAPDMVLRAERLVQDLPVLASMAGVEAAAPTPQAIPGVPPLSELYSEDIEKAARDLYQRDYMAFGYRAWA